MYNMSVVTWIDCCDMCNHAGLTFTHLFQKPWTISTSIPLCTCGGHVESFLIAQQGFFSSREEAGTKRGIWWLGVEITLKESSNVPCTTGCGLGLHWQYSHYVYSSCCSSYFVRFSTMSRVLLLSLIPIIASQWETVSPHLNRQAHFRPTVWCGLQWNYSFMQRLQCKFCNSYCHKNKLIIMLDHISVFFWGMSGSF